MENVVIELVLHTVFLKL